jgi:tetratricopeptide (TPR) repeat protein
MGPHEKRAHQLIELGRFDQAIEHLQLSLGEDPDNADIYAMLGICFSQTGRATDAIAACEKAIGLEPDADFVHHAYGAVLNDQDRFKQAEVAAREAVSLDPDDVDNHRLLAVVLLNRHHFKDALTSAEHGLAIDAEDVECLNCRAIALTKLGRRDEAGEAIQTALERDPENADTHANLGWTMLHAGRHREAQDHFRQALQLQPTHDWARQGILESLKARNLIYRWLLAYFLWMSGFSPKIVTALIIGMVVAINLLTRLTPETGPVAVAVEWFVYAYLAFVFLTWLGNDLFNLLLRLDHFGRMVLSDRERRDSTILGAAILYLGAIAIWTGIDTGEALAGLIYMLPLLAVSTALHAPPGKARNLLALATIVIMVSGTAAFVRERPQFIPTEVVEARSTMARIDAKYGDDFLDLIIAQDFDTISKRLAEANISGSTGDPVDFEAARTRIEADMTGYIQSAEHIVRYKESQTLLFQIMVYGTIALTWVSMGIQTAR